MDGNAQTNSIASDIICSVTMGKTCTVETIVLATHNVGEADRFCILFTKELGKITARARSVRKPTSRMGGSILPLQHLMLQIRESSAGWQISDVSKLSQWNERDIHTFLLMQQGTELLISILHEDEPLPEIFQSTLKFFTACSTQQKHTVLPFTIQLLEFLGLLPGIDDAYFVRCSEIERSYLRKSVSGHWDELPDMSSEQKTTFSTLLAPLLSQISSTPLKSGGVICDMKAQV